MELEKRPETELEYWATIEQLGGFIWRMNHDLADGRITDPDGAIDHDINQAHELTQQLLKEIEDKFGVIPPDLKNKQAGEKSAPPGKIHYWDWYKQMKRQCYNLHYQSLICSACPFSDGLDRYVALGSIPCGIYPGTFVELKNPFTCQMVHRKIRSWNDGILHSLIKRKFGSDTLAAFKAKKQELMNAPSETATE